MGKAITKIILGLIFGFVLLIIVNRIHNYFEEQSYRIEVVGENGKVYESYNEALNNLDFVAAHSFVDKMNESEKREQTKEIDKKDDFTKTKIVLDKLERIASGSYEMLNTFQAQTILDYINDLCDILREILESEGE